jgi:hypothetical protein
MKLQYQKRPAANASAKAPRAEVRPVVSSTDESYVKMCIDYVLRLARTRKA